MGQTAENVTDIGIGHNSKETVEKIQGLAVEYAKGEEESQVNNDKR